MEKARRKRKHEALDKLTVAKRKFFAEEERAKTRKRVQKHRQAKMAGTENIAGSEIENIAGSETNRNGNLSRYPLSKTTFDFNHSYKTTSTIRKDYTKINKSLPLSPSRRKVQVTKLLRSFDERDRQDILGESKSTPKEKESRFCPDLITAVKKFYERDDVSSVTKCERCKMLSGLQWEERVATITSSSIHTIGSLHKVCRSL